MWKQSVKLIFYFTLTVVLLGSTNFESATFFYDSDQENRREPAVTVGMTNTMKFTPDTVRIQKGETVRWENSSLIVHTVTGDPSLETIEGSVQLPDQAETFDSGMMDPEQTFEHTFNVSGTYKYFCIPHEGTKMYGWVIVE